MVTSVVMTLRDCFGVFYVKINVDSLQKICKWEKWDLCIFLAHICKNTRKFIPKKKLFWYGYCMCMHCLLIEKQNRLGKSIFNSFSRFLSTVVHKSNLGPGCTGSLLQHLLDEYICHSFWQTIHNRWQIKIVLYLVHFLNVSKTENIFKNHISFMTLGEARVRKSTSHF